MGLPSTLMKSMTRELSLEYNAGAMENIGCVTIRIPIYESKLPCQQRTRGKVTVLHEARVVRRPGDHEMVE